MSQELIQIKGAYTHNLKNLNLDLKKYAFNVITGVSGSGKSSLAFETIHKSGKKHYLQTLLSSNRHLKELLKEPKVKSIDNLGPTIALKQSQSKTTRLATLATQTRLYSLISSLWANLATPYCPTSQEKMQKSSLESVFEAIIHNYNKCSIDLAAPVKFSKETKLASIIQELRAQGFLRIKIENKLYRLEDEIKLKDDFALEIDVIIDRITVENKNFERLKNSLQNALQVSKGLVYVFYKDKRELFSDALYSKESKEYYKNLTAQDFHFQSPNSACTTCLGLAKTHTFDEEKILDPEKSIQEEFCIIAPSFNTIKWSNIFENLARIYKFKTSTPFKKLRPEVQEMLLYGSKKKWLEMHFKHTSKNLSWTEYVNYMGIIPMAEKRLSEASSKSYKEKMHALMQESVCKSCGGSRLRPFASFAKLNNLTIQQFCALEIHQAIDFIKKTEIKKTPELNHLLSRIQQTLALLVELGLDYLTLDRSFNSLSTGEAQRSRLISQIASTFSNTTYILDEPSIGLHPQDNQKLINALKKLQKNDNTLIIVEHDEQIIKAADYLVDLGPGGGQKGGHVVFSGANHELMKANTLTADYITGKKQIAQVTKTLSPKKFIHVKKANQFNLKNLSVKIPLHCMCSITGVCGSGKSTLIFDVVKNGLAQKSIEADTKIEQVYCIDQSPVTRSPRSTLCTYIKVFDDIRTFFSSLKMSQIANLTKGHFSFNTKDASCSLCKGLGSIPSSNPLVDSIICSLCNGQKFEKSVLNITYKDKNISQVLDMTVLEAYEHFIDIAPIASKLELLIQVGLDYLTLKQRSCTLSGGEAQRIKLSKSLVKKTRGHTLYMFDEPTTGLHFHDITKLIKILKNLVSKGHSVIIIEHHLDLIKSSDYLIELGPKGGYEGGKLLYSGPTKKLPKSTPTGKFLYSTYQQETATIKPRIDKKQIQCINVSENRNKPINIAINYNQISLLEGSKKTLKTTFAKKTLFFSAYEQYYQTLSPFEKSLLKPLNPAKVDLINNLLPTVYCEKQETNNNPRSTLGTYSGIYDLLRTIWAHMAKHYCPVSQERLVSVSEEFILETLLRDYNHKKCRILCPLETKKGLSFQKNLKYFESIGFLRIRMADKIYPIDELYDLDENLNHELDLVVDSLTIKEQVANRLLDSITLASKHSNKRVRILIDHDVKDYHLSFCAPNSMLSYDRLTEASFSFNDEKGMCQRCKGIGSIYEINLRDDRTLLEYSSQDLLSLFLKHNLTKKVLQLISNTFKLAKCPISKPLKLLSDSQLNFALDAKEPSKQINNDPQFEFLGLHTIIKNTIDANQEIHDLFCHLMQTRICPSCKGCRLNPLPLNSKIQGKTITQVSSMPLDKLYSFMRALETDNALNSIKQKILHDLQTALDLNLDSLSLSRQLNTLSSSQMQKFNLARLLSAKLTNTLFIFDNPTHSLCLEDIELLKQKILKLKNEKNTILLITHNEELKSIAEEKIMLEASTEKIDPNLYKNSNLTNEVLQITDKKTKKRIDVKRAKLNLLSGSISCYKTSFVRQILKKSLDQYILHGTIKTPYLLKNHESIGVCLYLNSNHQSQTNRSDIATFLAIAPKLRIFYSNLPSAKIKGLSSAHFSYNHRLGMCKTCKGIGSEKLYISNFEQSHKTCSDCNGLKLNNISNSVTYKGLSFYQLIQKPVYELEQILIHERGIQNSCRLLKDFNLSNLRLSDRLQDLSSSETSLIYLIDVLKKKKKNSLIILDNITTSFDTETMNCFLRHLSKLTKQGHTIIIVDQNPIFIKIADHQIKTRDFFTSKDLQSFI